MGRLDELIIRELQAIAKRVQSLTTEAARAPPLSQTRVVDWRAEFRSPAAISKTTTPSIICSGRRPVGMTACRRRCLIPTELAPTFGDADLTTPFPFNAFYEEALAPVIDGADYKLELSGLIEEQARLDARTAARPAPDDPDYAPCLCRRLERHWQMGRGSFSRIFRAHRRRSPPRVTSASAAPTNIRRASTCPRPCTRCRIRECLGEELHAVAAALARASPPAHNRPKSIDGLREWACESARFWDLRFEI